MLRIQEFPASRLGPEIGYPYQDSRYFPEYLQANFGFIT
jgi:hypothetical protein